MADCLGGRGGCAAGLAGAETGRSGLAEEGRLEACVLEEGRLGPLLLDAELLLEEEELLLGEELL